MPGAGTARLTRDLEDPRRFMSFAPWESLETMHAWKSNPEFRERMGAVQAHVDEFTPTELELAAEV
jgi:heme-degrading monooxygenase HmoA